MLLNSHSAIAVSRIAMLTVALTVAGCSGAKDLAKALKEDDRPVAGTGGNGNSDTPKAAANVAIGAGVSKTSKSVEGGGLFVKIPDLGKVKVTDRSPQGGNGVTWTPNAADTKVTIASKGKLAGGGALPGSLTMDKDRDISGPAFAVYETHSPVLGGDGFEIDYKKKYTVRGADIVSAYADAADEPVFLKYAKYGGYSQVTGAQYAKVDVEGEGTWHNKTIGGSSILAAIFGGTPTAKNDMPTGVTATFNGTFMGIGVPTSGKAGIDDVNTSEILGDVSLKANFGSGAVTGNVYNMVGENAGCLGSCAEVLPLGLKLNGKINPTAGNTYQGDAAFTGAAKTAASAASQATVGKVTSSDFVGQFYGPKAAETAGAVRVEGTIPTLMDRDGKPYGPGMVIGSFGAKKGK